MICIAKLTYRYDKEHHENLVLVDKYYNVDVDKM